MYGECRQYWYIVNKVTAEITDWNIVFMLLGVCQCHMLTCEGLG